MEQTIYVLRRQGNTPMDLTAPEPTGKDVPVHVTPEREKPTFDTTNPSAVSVTIAGCGGCGINLSRPFKKSDKLANVLYFDTSMTNTRNGESAFIVTNGSGSGSNRAENAHDIERVIPQISDEDIGKADVAIVMFSLSGGKLAA